jgi:hypothetical protein
MRRPVLRFVLVVAALAVALGALAWTGAAAPAVTAQTMGEGTEADGELGYLLALVENRGSLPVRVTQATWTSEALGDAELFVGPEAHAPDAMVPFEPFSLAGGERRVIMLRGTIECPLPGDRVTVATDPLEITAKPAAGPSRHVQFATTGRGPGMDRTLPCPRPR